MWQCVPTPLRERALLEVTNLEASMIDQDTCDELSALCRKQGGFYTQSLLQRLWYTRGVVKHPLNSDFLHKTLGSLEVAQRDLIWTEWVRHNRQEILDDLHNLECRWRESDRTEEDAFLAKWVLWILTSSVRYLRDEATKALYWYGLYEPRSLFEFTLMATDVNDPYVSERMFAASYGVVMGSQRNFDSLRNELAMFIEEINRRFVGESAQTPTNHWMIRIYVQGEVDPENWPSL
jgi:hypothetical protein